MIAKAFAALTGQAHASIEDQAVIDKILQHLQARGVLPPSPELLPGESLGAIKIAEEG